MSKGLRCRTVKYKPKKALRKKLSTAKSETITAQVHSKDRKSHSKKPSRASLDGDKVKVLYYKKQKPAVAPIFEKFPRDKDLKNKAEKNNSKNEQHEQQLDKYRREAKSKKKEGASKNQRTNS